MTAGQRFPLPAKVAYPLLSMVAAALVWFAVSRVGELPRRAAVRRRGERGVRDRQRQARRRATGPMTGRPASYAPEGQYVTYGQGRPGPARPRGDFPGGPAARPADGRDRVTGRDRGRRPGPQPRPPERPYRRDRDRGPREPAADERPARSRSRCPGPRPVTESGRPARPARPAWPGRRRRAPARPYGRILIFTLLDDRVADFDRLAEEAAEYVRTGEPDTLVYVIHLVPNAPLQRIFYEIYRDRAAFDSHESQPYMQRFVAERRTCVLATNVIELRLKYAKVAPLPGPQPLLRCRRRRRRHRRGGSGPRCRSGPGRCPRPARSVPIAASRPAAV